MNILKEWGSPTRIDDSKDDDNSNQTYDQESG